MVTGEFVDVHKGAWKGKKSDLDIVVKSLKSNAPQEEKIKLLQEAVIMGQFHHPNILQFYGVVNEGATVSMHLLQHCRCRPRNSILSGGTKREKGGTKGDKKIHVTHLVPKFLHT